MKFLITLFILSSFAAYAADTKDMNTANNPLTPMLGLNFQDYYTSSLFGSDDTANAFLLRGTLPQKIGGLPQITRLTVPYQNAPRPGRDGVNGLGDINIFDIFLMKPVNGVEFGVGPYFVFPTATEDETGAGKWQAGASAVAIKPGDWGMMGALLTYQHSFAGPSERPTQNLATLQPFLIYNLPKSFYVRSSGVMNFNWQNGHYYIPIGAGAGKVWKLKSGTIMNLFVEPQWTIAHEGDGQPNFQTFMGLNLQFPLGH
ncbi:hypothetical protein ACJVC5_17770 [Peredibacter sp. HCB2-198]|uniref:hypothetical protein n=1 Tax=Peredibacter sp. HCB2-198 TaxID=3383025 RepID=UPI0038B692F7